MRATTNPFNGSALLAFDSKSLWQKAFRGTAAAAMVTAAAEETSLLSSNPVTHSHAIYLSEPEDVRKCLEKQSPNHNFCLILTNKSI